MFTNKETANIGLDSSVGRAPVRLSSGRGSSHAPINFSLFKTQTIIKLTGAIFGPQKVLKSTKAETHGVGFNRLFRPFYLRFSDSS